MEIVRRTCCFEDVHFGLFDVLYVHDRAQLVHDVLLWVVEEEQLRRLLEVRERRNELHEEDVANISHDLQDLQVFRFDLSNCKLIPFSLGHFTLVSEAFTVDFSVLQLQNERMIVLPRSHFLQFFTRRRGPDLVPASFAQVNVRMEIDEVKFDKMRILVPFVTIAATTA